MSVVSQHSEPLLKYLNALEPLSNEVVTLAKAETFLINIKKNAILPYKIDEHEEFLFFIVKGIVRGFIVDEGKDITAWLTDENNLIGNIRNPGMSKSLFEAKYQALEDVKLLVIPYALIDKLYSKFPETNILGRKLLAIHYHMSQERSILSRIPSAEARYKQFKECHPLLSFRIPVKFLATYLGMRIETLSRIRKKNIKPHLK